MEVVVYHVIFKIVLLANWGYVLYVLRSIQLLVDNVEAVHKIVISVNTQIHVQNANMAIP